MAKKIEIYTTPVCPYCQKAKRLLDSKGVTYTEIDVTREPGLREYMKQRTGGRQSVPQVFIDEQHIGGCDDLHALDAQGGLDPLLKGDSS
ncbi:Glutaredoxin 3 (Grx2) [invertebrate metagenome]|uniref:Glutaredoxin 3 (Grx2) n=1 Tax=invertebrate metagenome TaxID=1711999 RepID=A0A484H4F6_9ZZZZ